MRLSQGTVVLSNAALGVARHHCRAAMRGRLWGGFAELSIASHIPLRSAARCASARMAPEAQSTLAQCCTNSLPPSEPS